VIIATALAVTLSRNGIGSFVTLGIIGAAIYTIPALIDMQVALGAGATPSRYISVPPDVEFVVLVAWLALLASLIFTVTFFSASKLSASSIVPDEKMRSIALACAIIGPLGLLYFVYAQESFLFFLQARTDQNSGAF
jgi:fumarate reductase subunit C